MEKSMDYRKVLLAAHVAMAVAFIICVGAVLVAYVYYESFSLLQQVGAHILLIVSPAALKLGYVARLTALHRLGLAVN
ncbi:hypothetical protein Sde_0103 [Saccharophagus degradans 2-40]|uniref:Uncharacterized protein n=2 Tax=Saccharophagus degradans TaxID=86304 RepID=Q21PL2_SACD2|nr:hypothetical protein Sde_0103 [Saccharophagus degradans 2-40]